AAIDSLRESLTSAKNWAIGLYGGLILAVFGAMFEIAFLTNARFDVTNQSQQAIFQALMKRQDEQSDKQHAKLKKEFEKMDEKVEAVMNGQAKLSAEVAALKAGLYKAR